MCSGLPPRSPRRLCLLFLTACGAVLPLQAQAAWQLARAVAAPGTIPQTENLAGSSVAVAGGMVAVGAPGDDTGNSDAGLVRVYDAASGALLHKLSSPGSPAGAGLGTRMAASGSRIAVSAPGDTQPGSGGGTVFIFDLAAATPEVPVAVLASPGAAGNTGFGRALAFSGSRVAVGAPLDDSTGINSGRVYLFDLAATPPLTATIIENPSPQMDEEFGSSVALNSGFILAGCRYDSTTALFSGTAYLYRISGGQAVAEAGVLANPTPATQDYFGESVALGEGFAAVGAPGDSTQATRAGAAWLFDLSQLPLIPAAVPLFSPVPQATDLFGTELAVSGSRVLVSAHWGNVSGLNDAGRAFLYERTGATPGVPVLQLENPSPAVFDQFGLALAMSGNSIAIGAPTDDPVAANSGSAWLFNAAGPAPSVPLHTFSPASPSAADAFGSAAALLGQRLLIGAPSENTTGRAWMYDLSNSAPPRLLENPGSGNRFGQAAALSTSHALVGAPEDKIGGITAGAVYGWAHPGSPGVPPDLLIPNPDPAASDSFGVSISADGNRVIVGATGDDTGASNAGSAFVFDLSGATPGVPRATLRNPTPATGENFGRVTSVHGARAAVGVPLDDSGAPDAGVVYVYDLSLADPGAAPLAIPNPSPAANEQFGAAVALGGTRLAVGASGENGFTGAVYVFDLTSATPAVPVHIIQRAGAPAGSLFGYRLQLRGDLLCVAAELDDSGLRAGAAWVYDLASAIPAQPVAALANPAPSRDDLFASALAMDADRVLCGAPGEDSTAYNKGAAWLFSSAVPTTPLEQWKLSNLGNAAYPDAGDPDKDGLSVLAEYGLGLSPQVSDVHALPAPSLHSYPDGTRLRLLVPRDPARSDITLEVVSSPDLSGPWTVIASSTGGQPFTGTGYYAGEIGGSGIRTVEIRDPQPPAGRKFFRIRMVR